MRYFPAFFDIKNRDVTIVGGGVLALRKARLLQKGAPKLTFIAPFFIEELTIEIFDATFIKADFAPELVPTNTKLLVAGNDDVELDTRVAEFAKSARIPVNVVDRPELCDFVIPSIVDRGDLVVGISTGGAAPVLGRNLRAQIEALLPKRLGDLIAFAKSQRPLIAEKITEKERRGFWERLFKSRTADAVLKGDKEAAARLMTEMLDAYSAPKGNVHIVGAGPGDPELLTLKALRVMQEADVILHDNLVTDEIMELARRDADRIYVGKKKSNHSLLQEEIGRLMIKLANEGKRVVRLKGGDPFIFGRGGEELDALNEAGITAEIVPGITAAIGCGAATSIPLTHRDHTQAVTFVTGHAKGDTDPDLNWSALAALNHTLVVYMGVGKADSISRNLIKAGQNGNLPVAIIENGTTDRQIIAKTTLAGLPTDIIRAGIIGPALLIIGDVAAKADGKGLLDLLKLESPAA